MKADELLQRYAEGERAFTGADLAGADLRGANLRGANLSTANLAAANLLGADLSGANLGAAHVVHANLTAVRLVNADLINVDLAGANLAGANLSAANLSAANLSGANLSAANLGQAAFHHSVLHSTNLVNVWLGAFSRAEVRHRGPSDVDFRSIVRSVNEPRLKDFLRATGMPDVFVEYMVDCARSLDPEAIFSLLQSTFISYGGPDEAFAQKLNRALEEAGVTTFFFKDDAPPGEKLHRVMRKGVNEHDRVILVCSESSLVRPGLLNELEETLQRESRDGGASYLIPIRLDDYVTNGWAPRREDLAQAVRDRVIADFREHENAESFRAEVAKLIRVLKKPQVVPKT